MHYLLALEIPPAPCHIQDIEQLSNLFFYLLEATAIDSRRELKDHKYVSLLKQTHIYRLS